MLICRLRKLLNIKPVFAQIVEYISLPIAFLSFWSFDAPVSRSSGISLLSLVTCCKKFVISNRVLSYLFSCDLEINSYWNNYLCFLSFLCGPYYLLYLRFLQHLSFQAVLWSLSIDLVVFGITWLNLQLSNRCCHIYFVKFLRASQIKQFLHLEHIKVMISNLNT